MRTQIVKFKRALLACALFTGFGMARVCLAQQWVPAGSPVSVPFDAVIAGWEAPAAPGLPPMPLYACRGGAAEGLGVQLGRFTPRTSFCDLGYGGAEFTVHDFAFLVMSWQPETGGFVPPNAVQGGVDSPSPGRIIGPPLYFCRGKIKAGGAASLQLGKIRPGFGGCLVPYSGKEISLGSYDVLVSLSPAFPLATVHAINGFVPRDAIRAGTDADGTPLYMCSAVFGGGTHPGKLHSSFGGCNISYGGVEHTISDYFVLVPDW